MKRISTFKRVRFLAIAGGFAATMLAFMPSAFATNYLTYASVQFTNMNAGAASSLIVSFKTSATNTGTNGSIVFSGWTGAGGTGTVATAPTIGNSLGSQNCTTLIPGSADLPGTPSIAGTAGTGTLTVTDSTALVASTLYCYVVTSGITANPTTAGQGTATLTAGSDGGTSIGFDIITSDQVTLTASVPPSYTLALSATSDALGTLSTGSVVGSTGITTTVNTNATRGWYLFGSDANTGLHSATQAYTVASTSPNTNTTITAGTEGYVTALSVNSQGTGAGTESATTAYNSSGSGNGSGLSSTNTYELASSTGTANTAKMNVKEYATISPTTPAAADYGDTITLVGSGSF